LAEEGMENSKAAREALRYYLEPLKARRIDTLILGCTHYPPFKRAIRAFLGERVRLIDSGEATARKLAIEARGAARARARGAQGESRKSRGGRAGTRALERGSLRCFVSDIPRQFEAVGTRFLGHRV